MILLRGNRNSNFSVIPFFQSSFKIQFSKHHSHIYIYIPKNYKKHFVTFLQIIFIPKETNILKYPSLTINSSKDQSPPSLPSLHTHTHASMHTPPAQHKTQNLPVAQSKVHYAIPCSNQDPKGERKREREPSTPNSSNLQHE